MGLYDGSTKLKHIDLLDLLVLLATFIFIYKFIHINMPFATTKNKITKSLEEMDEAHLQSAYFILKEFVNQQKYTNVKFDTNTIDTKISKGIQQLDNGQATDFSNFLNEMQESYGKRK